MNESQKNNLTGPAATTINAFLAAYDPFNNLSVISLNDRRKLIEYLKIPVPFEWDKAPIGTRIVQTNAILYQGLHAAGVAGSARTVSRFCYSEAMKSLWKPRSAVEEESASVSLASAGDDLLRFWVEKTNTKGRPDRQLSENALGQSLWSPQKARDGKDIYRAMLEIKPGDTVFHFVDNQKLEGFSTVAARVDSSFIGLDGTDWAGRPAYRIALANHQPLTPPIERAEFLGDGDYRPIIEQLLKKQKGLFFNREFNLNEGAYITEAPVELIQIWNDIYKRKTGSAIIPGVPALNPSRPPSTPLNLEYSLADCAKETGFEIETLARWKRALQRKGQAIFYGPPGTGKTFIAERLAKHIIGGTDGFHELVQFHPAYSYEDFMQGIRPETVDDRTLCYTMARGRFMDFCATARQRTGPSVMVIDEINRADLSRVFGELMYLLEYRNREIPLSGGGVFQIPQTVQLIGTMNTADRSIALVDHALRRRFTFIALHPEYEILSRFQEAKGFNASGLIRQLKLINSVIADRHYEVGITFFLCEDLAKEIADIWQMEIEPYLEEFFFDQPQKFEQFRWDMIRHQILP